MGSELGLPFCLRSDICQVEHYVDRAHPPSSRISIKFYSPL